ncbi:hypothetical protein CLV45_0077 [Hymenobacter chitinivorans DSM 11115]|uniref:Uncharacterized protein n=2 Tax=Hymenobacter chitinivorans TaxID=89969 RepID=A0A2M9BL36_9BACT|nr:hypothetical protein CLV45_0077 [Hymenobacter chitinivorans DSM 11115]
MITEAMDIVLVDTNGYRTHNYNLPFDVIGQLY